MGLFGRAARKKRKDAEAAVQAAEANSETRDGSTDAEADGAEVATPSAERPPRPWDSTEVPEPGTRIDLGALWLPGIHGMQVRMEIDKKSEQVTGVALVTEGSGLQVQAFAAPRSEGIWDEIREEIQTSLVAQGATVDDIVGPFGRELLAQIPATDANGTKVRRVVRFLGADGPRWFVRGVVTGNAATDAEAAKPIEDLFANIVVVRDQVPRAPRDLLALTMPQARPVAAGASAPASNNPTPDGPEGATPAAPDFNPLKRGPEITEIR